MYVKAGSRAVARSWIMTEKVLHCKSFSYWSAEKNYVLLPLYTLPPPPSPHLFHNGRSGTECTSDRWTANKNHFGTKNCNWSSGSEGTSQESTHTVNVDFLRIEYMVLAKYQHMSILELILIIKQHILILCKKTTHVIKLGFALRFISTRAICLP